MRRTILVILGAWTLIPLAGCGKAGDNTGDKTGAASTGEPGAATLTAAIGGAAGMSTMAAALKNTGLGTVFEGTAPYTVLAPQDDAFGAMGETAAMLKAPENGAAMAAVIKAHVLPGYMAVADIDAALKTARGKPVKMTTMAGSEVTFTRTGDTLTVTAADGSTARLSGAEVKAGNGVAIPIDGVLKKIPEPPAG